jgi:hypothetical protein
MVEKNNVAACLKSLKVKIKITWDLNVLGRCCFENNIAILICEKIQNAK